MSRLNYNYHAVAEILWAILIAVIVQAAQIIVASDLERVTDWRSWFISLLAAVTRAGAAALLAKLTTPKTQPPAPPPVDLSRDQRLGG